MARKPSTKQTFDLELVRSAAARRWPEILAKLSGHDAELFDGNHHGCPLCGGVDRFRLIDADAGAVLCNQCLRDKNGDGFAALQWLCSIDFVESLKRVAGYLGIETSAKPRQRKENSNPAKDLKFLPWNDGLAETWCVLHKPGIKPAAMRAAGCRLARDRDEYTVFALPVYGPKLAEADPVGWCLYNVAGGTLPKFKKGQPVAQVKTKLTYGSQPGVMGPVERIAAAATIIKTEGPSDMLAMLSLANLPDHVVAVSNANGAGERPAQWMLELFTEKLALVVHDADKPGERGATGYDNQAGGHRPGWVELIAAHASDCRHVRLPYAIAEDHGKDLRDWLAEGNGYAELVTLAGNTTPAPLPVGATGPAPIEAEDDPHRLARLFLAQRHSHADGPTLRMWRQEWWAWDGHRYYTIDERELRSTVRATIKAEFDRINVELQSDTEAEDRDSETHKVSNALVSNTMGAIESMVTVAGNLNQPRWLNRSPDDQPHMIAFRNGVLNLDLALQIEYEMLDLSPLWFSPICLPYGFDHEAECPRWLAFLERNLEDDQERIKLLQEWVGYCLTDNLHEAKFLILEGEGANGKSVFLAAIEAMLGFENCSFVPLEVFGKDFGLTPTLGKLANICGDAGEVDKVGEGHIKSFTAGNPMSFNRKGLKPVDATPTAKLMVACNTVPRFNDKTDGMSRRMVLMPWRVKIDKDDQVKGMAGARWWQRSGELPGIFSWALTGLLRLQEQSNFTRSKVCEEAQAGYQQDNNPTRVFLTDSCTKNTGGSIPTAEVYAEYRAWCEVNGYRAASERTFGRDVFRCFPGMVKKRLGTGSDRFMVYYGISFAEDFQQRTGVNQSNSGQRVAF